MIVTMTDGMENASKEFTRPQIAEMVKHQEEKYAWEFIYLGANQDAFAIGGALGMRRENTANFAATGVGTRSAYDQFDKLTTSYVQGGSTEPVMISLELVAQPKGQK